MRALLPFRTPTILLWIMCALALRMICFLGYIQYEERYWQSDSTDYHAYAVLMAHGRGMTMPTGQPIFWRTPGYPAYLALVYQYLGAPGHLHISYAPYQIWWALLIQIIWCSILPLLVAWLAWILTHSLILSTVAGWIAVVHPAYVLASTYLLTDGPAQILSMFFLILFMSSLLSGSRQYLRMILSALVLALFTWMRPMGQFISLLTALYYSVWGQAQSYLRIKGALLFLCCFIMCLTPWIVRNYTLTHQYFFCPLFGLYVNVFSAPKIKARIDHIPLEQAHQELCQHADRLRYEQALYYHQNNIALHTVGENIAMQSAWPLIRDHPGYFIYDWLIQSCKTAFDLYSYQLLALHQNICKWDPLIEYLSVKTADTLYAQPLPTWMRMIAWLELILSILLWIGIIYGCYLWIVAFDTRTRTWWAYAALLSAFVCLQTGGFGYARLRLPIEPLILICGLYGLSFIIDRFNQRGRVSPTQHVGH